MPFRRTILWAVVVLAVGVSPGNAKDISAEYRQDVRSLLEMTNAAQLGAQFAENVMRSVVQRMTKTNPDVPQEFVDLLVEKMRPELAAGMKEISDNMIDIYARHFTHPEIKQLIAFYRTDVGKKTITKMPVLMQEGSAAGQAWVARNGNAAVEVAMKRAMERYKAAHPEKK